MLPKIKYIWKYIAVMQNVDPVEHNNISDLDETLHSNQTEMESI